MLYLVDFKNHEFIYCKFSENIVEAKIRILLDSGVPKKYLKVFYDESYDPDCKEHDFEGDFLDVDTFREFCSWNLKSDEEVVSYLVDMDMRRKDPSFVPFIVNSWDDFYTKYPIDRDEMDIDTEKEYIEDAYKLYEAEGFSEVFSIKADPSFLKEYADCVDKPFEVIGRSYDFEEYDFHDDLAGLLPSWRIRFSNGKTLDAWPAVICPGYASHPFDCVSYHICG